MSDWSSDGCSSYLPARAPKRDEGSRVVDTAAIVGAVKARAALVAAQMNVDPSGARAAGILEQLVEHVGDRHIEQARYLRDEFIADRWPNLAAKRPDRTPRFRATSMITTRPHYGQT